MWRVYFYVFVVLKVVSSHLVSRTDLVVYVPYSGKYLRVLVFSVFADRHETAKFVTSKD